MWTLNTVCDLGRNLKRSKFYLFPNISKSNTRQVGGFWISKPYRFYPAHIASCVNNVRFFFPKANLSHNFDIVWTFFFPKTNLSHNLDIVGKYTSQQKCLLFVLKIWTFWISRKLNFCRKFTHRIRGMGRFMDVVQRNIPPNKEHGPKTWLMSVTRGSSLWKKHGAR